MILKSTPTVAEAKRARFLEIFEALLDSYEEDIESGLDEGIYEESENEETVSFIAEAREALEFQRRYRPEVYAYIEGGNLQGVSATEPVSFELFDQDNLDAAQYESSEEEDSFVERHGTAEGWDEMIKTKTNAGELTAVY